MSKKYEDLIKNARINADCGEHMSPAEVTTLLNVVEATFAALAAEISRRDAIFVPVYPDENTMNRMTDVFHDTAKIYCDEDSVFVENAELVITAIINHYIKSGDAFLAEVRASGVDVARNALIAFVEDEVGPNGNVPGLIRGAELCESIAAQLRQDAAQ